jgi:hypothetical protein
LTDTLASAVCEFAPQLVGEAVVLLAVDCHPWHGRIALAALTAAEVAADPPLADPAEMAAWRYYDFTEALSAWQPAARLGREMRAAYEAGDRPQVADAYLRTCARAVGSAQFTAALACLQRASGFRVSVTHPDDGREFVTVLQRTGG